MQMAESGAQESRHRLCVHSAHEASRLQLTQSQTHKSAETHWFFLSVALGSGCASRGPSHTPICKVPGTLGSSIQLAV